MIDLVKVGQGFRAKLSWRYPDQIQKIMQHIRSMELLPYGSSVQSIQLYKRIDLSRSQLAWEKFHVLMAQLVIHCCCIGKILVFANKLFYNIMFIYKIWSIR